MFNVKKIHEWIKVGSGKSILASKIGDLEVKMKKADGTMQIAVIKGIKYAEQVWVKLLSIPVLLSQGYNLGNNGMKIVLTGNQD